MVDTGLEQAFAKVRTLLEGDFEHPNLTLYDLQQLVGYPAKGDGPLSYALPNEGALAGVSAVRFFYYPKDPEVNLIVEIEDKSNKRHLRHFKWDGVMWVAPSGFKADLTATREVLPKVTEIEGDFYTGFSKTEAQELARAVRRGEAVGARYLLCTRDNTRVFYSPSVPPNNVTCPRCANATLIFKSLTFATNEDRYDTLLRETRALRTSVEDLLLYLKRKLGP